MIKLASGTLSLDCETTGLDLYHGAKPFLVTFYDGLRNIYFEWPVNPITRQPKVNPNDVKTIQAMIDGAKWLVMQNAKFDITALRTIGVNIDLRRVHDTLLAGHLLASSEPHDLNTMALVYLDVDITKYETDLRQTAAAARRLVRTAYPDWQLAAPGNPTMPSAKASVAQFDYWLPLAVAEAMNYAPDHPWRAVCANYANTDSSVTYHLLAYQINEISRRKLWPIYLARLRVIAPALAMERRGVTVSRRRLMDLIKEFESESKRAGDLCQEIALEYGVELELPKTGTNRSLATAIFEGMKLKSTQKSRKTGQPSLNKVALEEMAASLDPDSREYLFLQTLRAKRKRDTAISYMQSYQRFWLPIRQGWYALHPSFNPTGTDTLRWSSSNPNAQNISKQEGFSLRRCFGPLPGREWWSLDYENIELRIPAYESGEEVMIEIFERPDDPPYYGSYHLLNASIVYPELFWPLAEERGAFKERYASTYYQWIKNFGFAISYGAIESSGTADRAAHKVGAQAMVANRLKKHAELNQRMIKQANLCGYVETMPDKTVCPERGYPLYCRQTRWSKVSPTVPLNYHVQGTAMWCTMKAMIRCHEYLSSLPNHYMVMQVHDEIVFDLPRDDTENNAVIANLNQLMTQSGDDIGVPLTVAATRHLEDWGSKS